MTQLYTVINTYKWTVFTCSRACCFEFNLGYFYGIVCCFTHEFSYLGPVCFFYGFCVFLLHFFVACLEFSYQYQCKQFAWCVCVSACKVFASTLLSSVKQAREMLRQQRAALCTSTDKVITATTNEQTPSTADVSQSDVSRLMSRYREAELQVCLGFSLSTYLLVMAIVTYLLWFLVTMVLLYGYLSFLCCFLWYYITYVMCYCIVCAKS